MKRPIVFMAILLGVFGVCAAVFIGLRNPVRSEAGATASQFLDSLRQSHQPLLEMNLAQLYGGGQFEVLASRLAISGGINGGTKALKVPSTAGQCDADQADAFGGERCQFAASTNEIDESEHKQLEFNRYLVEGQTPPESFVTSPPFISAEGPSYAYLLTQNSAAPYNESGWVEQHLSLFKTSELATVMNRFSITNPSYSLMARLDDASVKELVEGAPLVLTQDHLLIKNQSRLGFSPLSYWVYDGRDVRATLAPTDYDLVPADANAFCVERIGSVCWTYNSRTALAFLHRYSLVALIVLALVFCALLALYIRYLLEKTREQQSYRLALQVLSHEFRTPVSAMLLLIEQLRAEPSRFDVNDGDLLTRLSTEIFRLQRTIEMSRNYLQVEGRRAPFQPVEIPSVNEWISDLAAEMNADVLCELLPRDERLRADVFWLKFMLSNLIQNALAHGKAPVVLRLNSVAGRLRITVEDHGVCEFDSLGKMTEPFVKSLKSKGMGLGLNLTKFIVNQWGGELEFSAAPTAFTLSLQNSERSLP